MNEIENFAATAMESIKDYRTLFHLKTDVPNINYTKGGSSYTVDDIENQYKVGICTAISTVQNANKALGKKFNADFQYLLQKIQDGNWDEGSSILSAMKVGNKIGFLPESYWTHTTKEDRQLPYYQYIAKLKAIPASEIARLKTMCTDKISSYEAVDVSAKENISHAIDNSQSGIICRYIVTDRWWKKADGSVSWLEKDINPLSSGGNKIGGHAIIASMYDFTIFDKIEHPNTWGITWNRQGKGDMDFNNYQPTEAWLPHYLFEVKNSIVYQLPPANTFHYEGNSNMYYGEKSDNVKQLQIALMIDGCLPLLKVEDMGTYGNKTVAGVMAFQIKHNIAPMEVINQLGGKQVGPLTRSFIKKLYAVK